MGWTMLVANDGGHIAQLKSLSSRFGSSGDQLWVTVPTEQTRSLLAGETVHWTGPAPTRGFLEAIRNARSIRPLFASRTFDVVVSTGSSLAVSALPQAAWRRIPTHYIESVTRTEGISVSGRILSHVPGISLYVQWPHLATGRWRYHGSVLDGFAVTDVVPHPVRRIVVSLGTSSRFGFRRLVERLVAVVPNDVDVLWQTGCTDVSGLGIDGRVGVPAAELASAISSADALVAHAGAGIAITALNAGKVPVLVPRSAARSEHVDDHQGQIAGNLAAKGLAFVVNADELRWADIVAATGRQASRALSVAPFELSHAVRRGR